MEMITTRDMVVNSPVLGVADISEKIDLLAEVRRSSTSSMSFFNSNTARRSSSQQPSHSPSAASLISSSLNVHDPLSKRSSSRSSLMQGPPYNHDRVSSRAVSISDKFSLSPDPAAWGLNISPDVPEPDDYLHDPDPRQDRLSDNENIFTYRGLTNLGCLILLCLGLLALFAGYPLVSHFTSAKLSSLGGFNIGGINASGQIPSFIGNYGLIDNDTPQSLYTKPSYADPSVELQLVFSDEFNVEGRTFYPGDDPYWEAVDLHYWQTNNLEWYDPSAVITRNGALEITLSQMQTHGLDYQGGLVATWNKFCFTGGLVETSVTLPGYNNIVGLWPAVWAMGNLGRAGYGASLEGMWPYSYDACDVGTVANQTINGQPAAATVNGDKFNGGALSYLPGQRLSRCTCPGESHPGPVHADGTYVGRAAPEIDVLEAQVTGTPLFGQVSQSAQWAPFNEAYIWLNTSENLIIQNPSKSIFNVYVGSVFQQATSVVTTTDQNCYEFGGTKCFSTYGFEYKTGFDDGYITWVSDSQVAWTMRAPGMGPDSGVQISERPIPQEPMYLIINLGMSNNFGHVDLQHLVFPTTMRVDWIRVYQPKNAINIGCDPKDFPTAAYINQYIEAYTNPNLTTWKDDYKQPFPKSKLLGQC